MRLLAALLALCLASQAKACGGAEACTIPEGSYHVLAPDDWDGVTPLPVLLHFHGWGRQGDLIVKHGRIAAHTRRRGVLLVAPNGAGRTWRFRQPDSRDVAFADAVLADAAFRFRIDPAQIFVSGYSYGAAMAWRYACDSGNDLRAVLAISGSLPREEDCAEVPLEVRQVYGLKDNVLPFPFGPGGDEDHPVALWRDLMGCGEALREGPWQAVTWLTLTRSRWDCDGGRVTLDVHPGGHFIPHGWIGWQLDQLMGRAPTYP